jgi:hypothetical protein
MRANVTVNIIRIELFDADSNPPATLTLFYRRPRLRAALERVRRRSCDDGEPAGANGRVVGKSNDGCERRHHPSDVELDGCDELHGLGCLERLETNLW